MILNENAGDRRFGFYFPGIDLFVFADEVCLLSAVFRFYPEMPCGGLRHGFMVDQGFDDAAMSEQAADNQQTYDDQNDGSGFHGFSFNI